MKFKKGDKAIINRDNPYSADLSKGNVVMVIRRNKYHGYEVRPVDGFTTWDIGEDCLDELKDLPIGEQLTFSGLCPVLK